jgi:hypothetical protein
MRRPLPQCGPARRCGLRRIRARRRRRNRIDRPRRSDVHVRHRTVRDHRAGRGLRRVDRTASGFPCADRDRGLVGIAERVRRAQYLAQRLHLLLGRSRNSASRKTPDILPEARYCRTRRTKRAGLGGGARCGVSCAARDEAQEGWSRPSLGVGHGRLGPRVRPPAEPRFFPANLATTEFTNPTRFRPHTKAT